MYYVYIMRCFDNSLYTGITTDLVRRFKEHSRGTAHGGAKYTAARRPMRIEAAWAAENRSRASVLESKIKKLRREKKEEIIQFGLPESWGDYPRLAVLAEGSFINNDSSNSPKP
jgi:putative endonuclease